MKKFFLVFPLLFAPSLPLTAEPVPRKPNIVTKFLDEILNSLFDHLSNNNFSIPLTDLEDVGNFSEVEGSISGLEKSLDGVKSHGFKLNVNSTKAVFNGKYHIVNLDIPGLFPIYGKGKFSVEMDLIETKITLTALRDFNTDKFLISLPQLEFQVEKAKVKFDNLMYEPNVADFLNELISNLVPPLMKMIGEPLKDVLHLPVNFYGNGIFDCLKLGLKEKITQCIKNLFGTTANPLEKLAADFVKKLPDYK